MKQQQICLHVNGKERDVGVEPNRTLLDVLRNEFELTGTKEPCSLGECGGCAVLLDGKPVLSCLTLVLDCIDREIWTIEGLSGEKYELLIDAFEKAGATQCGFCTPSMIVVAWSAICRGEVASKENEEKLIDHLSGNLCRCTGYEKIKEGCEKVARELQNRSFEQMRGDVTDG